MTPEYWQRQAQGKPLFPDLLWSRPENRTYAGKLLVIGGNAHGMAAPAEAFAEAEKAGVGSCRVILPQSLKRLAGGVLPAVEFAMHNPSGGFSQMALGEMLQQAQWADGILLAGDFGRNSETAILLEKFLEKFQGQVTLTKDAVDYFTTTVQPVGERPQTTLVLSFSQLQKFATGSKFTTAFTFDMDFLRLIEALHDFTQQHPVNIVTKHLDTIFVAVDGQVSTTKLNPDPEIWRVRTAAHTATWWLQNPSQTFEALTTALVQDGPH